MVLLQEEKTKPVDWVESQNTNFYLCSSSYISPIGKIYTKAFITADHKSKEMIQSSQKF